MFLNPKILLPLTILLALGGIFFGYQSLTTFREAEITIEWETASEVDTVGFNILRSESPEGDFTQINCLGLAVYLIQATSVGDLGFVVLDDPVQSMDESHSERASLLGSKEGEVICVDNL